MGSDQWLETKRLVSWIARALRPRVMLATNCIGPSWGVARFCERLRCLRMTSESVFDLPPSSAFPELIGTEPQADGLWHDGAMAKRSKRIAKRDEFENALKEVEEKIRTRRGKNPLGVAVEATGRPEGREGESAAVELDPDGGGK